MDVETLEENAVDEESVTVLAPTIREEDALAPVITDEEAPIVTEEETPIPVTEEAPIPKEAVDEEPVHISEAEAIAKAIEFSRMLTRGDIEEQRQKAIGKPK